MFRQEFLRLWNHRILWLLLILLLGVNGAMFWRQFHAQKQGGGYTTEQYKELWERLREYPEEERQTVFEQWRRNADVLLFYSSDMPPETLTAVFDPEETGWVLVLLEEYHEHPEEVLLTGEVECDVQLLTAVAGEIQTVAEYPEYRQEMKARGELLLSGSILTQQENTYNIRNLEKTLKDFSEAEMPEIKGIYDNSKGVESVSFSVTGPCCLVLLLYAAAELFVYEKEQGLEALVRTAARGRLPRLHGKLLAFTAFSVLTGSLFFAENLFLAQTAFGLGDLTRPIQTVEAYVSSLYNFTVWEYLLALYALWLLALIVCAMLMAVCTVPVRSTQGCALLAGAILGTEYALHVSIGSTSHLSAFRFVNLIGALPGDEVLATYRNINLLGYPASYPKVMLGLCAVLLMSSYVVLAFSFGRRYTERIGRSLFPRLRRKERRELPVYSVRLWQQELYRIGILRRGLVIFPVLLLFGAWWIVDMYQPPEESADQRYYQQYVAKWQGEITPDKRAEINEEALRFAGLEEELERLLQKQAEYGMNGDSEALRVVELKLMLIYNQLTPRNAFDAFCRYVEYLESTEEGAIVDQRPYEELLLTAETDVKASLYVILALLLLLPPFFSKDRENKMIGVVSVTGKGRRLLHLRLFYATVGTVGITAVALAARYYAVQKTLPVSSAELRYSACSVEGLSEYCGWSLGQYMTYAVGLRIVGACMVMLLIFGIVHIVNKTVIQWLLFAMLFVLPLVAAMLYAPLTVGCVPLSGLIGSAYFILWPRAFRWGLLAGILLAGIASEIVICKKYSKI
ncbi:MAG: hypothetical protein Q4C48_03660 [Lachnospiraceae bacterium]|nr:hypothetical protein [Lachnospiraceae bacterium]